MDNYNHNINLSNCHNGNSKEINKISLKVKKVFVSNNTDYIITNNNTLYSGKSSENTIAKFMDNVSDVYGNRGSSNYAVTFFKKTNGDIYAIGARSTNVIEPFNNTTISRPTLISLN